MKSQLAAYYLDKSLAELPSLSDPRLRTTNIDQAELATLEGVRFDAEIDEEFGVNETKYFLFDMPDESEEFAIALQNRNFQTAEGFAEYEILWNSTGFVAGTEIPSFNENKRSTELGGMRVYRLDDGTDPTDDGDVRESGFTGQDGFFSGSGSVDPRLGIRVYDDTFFILKITNGPDAQRIKCAYEWFKIPTTTLNL